MHDFFYIIPFLICIQLMFRDLRSVGHNRPCIPYLLYIIKNADKIIVLSDGKAVGIGTHEELMESCQVYQQIALSQLSKEELAG